MKDQTATSRTRSSTGFSADISPDPHGAAIVSAIAAASSFTGGLLLLLTRLDWLIELPLAIAFVTGSVIEWRRFHRRLSGVTHLRVYASGDVRVCRFGEWYLGQMAAGSLVLRRLAWIRVSGASGARVDCLCLKRSTKISNWRRFRLVSRHIGAIN